MFLWLQLTTTPPQVLYLYNEEYSSRHFKTQCDTKVSFRVHGGRYKKRQQIFHYSRTVRKTNNDQEPLPPAIEQQQHLPTTYSLVTFGATATLRRNVPRCCPFAPCREPLREREREEQEEQDTLDRSIAGLPSENIMSTPFQDFLREKEYTGPPLVVSQQWPPPEGTDFVEVGREDERGVATVHRGRLFLQDDQV